MIYAAISGTLTGKAYRPTRTMPATPPRTKASNILPKAPTSQTDVSSYVELPPSHSSRRHGNYTQKPHAPPRSQALRHDTGGFMATSTDVTRTPTPKKHTATPRRNVWTHRQEQPADTSTCHKARTCRRPTRSSQLSAAPLPTPDGVMPYRPAVGCRTGQAPSVPPPAYGATDRRRVTADRIFCRSGRIFRTAGRISHQCGRTE